MSNQLDNMQLLLANMRLNYLDEMPERINTLENTLLALEAHPENQEQYNELFRHIHSMKGSGGTYGIATLTHICHQMENFLPEIQGEHSAKNSAIANLFLCIDLLRETRAAAMTSAPNYTAIEAQLSSLYQSIVKYKKTILIADTSITLTDIYRQTLTPLPVQITCINDGLSALEQLLRYPYDLLIAGKELKTLNAYSLMAALRYSTSSNQKIPGILLSSSNEPEGEFYTVTIRRDKNQTTHLFHAVCAQLDINISL